MALRLMPLLSTRTVSEDRQQISSPSATRITATTPEAGRLWLSQAGAMEPAEAGDFVGVGIAVPVTSKQYWPKISNRVQRSQVCGSSGSTGMTALLTQAMPTSLLKFAGSGLELGG